MKNTYRAFAWGLLAAGVITTMPQTANADETSVYESLSDVPIGRVFFSPQQRVHLDKKRGATVRGKKVSTSTSAASPKNDAAGFIISASGLKQVYSNGDFVKTARSTAVAFPGDVRVVRQPEVDEEASDDSD